MVGVLWTPDSVIVCYDIFAKGLLKSRRKPCDGHLRIMTKASTTNAGELTLYGRFWRLQIPFEAHVCSDRRITKGP